MVVKCLIVLNGDKGWAQAAGQNSDVPPNYVPFLKDLFYALRMPQVVPQLTDGAFKLAPLGEVKVGDRPALGVTVTHKDRKDVGLYFDKETGLPVKAEVRLTDPDGKETTVEAVYADYKEFDGLKHPGKITIKVDDKEFTLEVS